MTTHERALELDTRDPLAPYRERFHLPSGPAPDADASGGGTDRPPWIYFCGNSLGLQPKTTRQAIASELDAWAALGVEGHFEGEHPWFSYDEPLRAPMARIVGAREDEVALMGSLTNNIHLLMVSFYRPTSERHRIVIEDAAFPSDRYVVASQAEFHGFDPDDAVVELGPRDGEAVVRTEDIEAFLEREGDTVALVLLGGVNYYTGQVFDTQRITRAAHAAGATVGFDMAHGAGNIDLKLHDHDVDFAAWCTYKYLNAGPGAVAGLFVHERHGGRQDLPRFAGWWGNDPTTRFQMPREFVPRPGAAGWQLSNVPIMSMAPLRASLEIFDDVGIEALREKSLTLTGFLIDALDALDTRNAIEIITPREPAARGCQISLRVSEDTISSSAPVGDAEGPIARRLHQALREHGVICDFRAPDVLRLAPVPLYNTYEEAWRFADLLTTLTS